MNEPLVSVCIPTYNRPKEVLKAIQSVLDQTYRNLELIVSDDSEISSMEIPRMDKRIRYFHNLSRLGMAANWSSCLDKASGEYVGLLMDDDLLLPTFVESALRTFTAYPNTGIVFANHFFSDGSEHWLRECPLEPGLYQNFLHPLLRLQPVAISATLMQRNLWEDLRPLPDLVTADFYMFLKAAQAGWAFYYIDEPLMIYHIHAGQLSSAAHPFREHVVRLWESFHFEDSQNEAIRRSRLAEALLSRAAMNLRLGNVEVARSDTVKARKASASTLAGRRLLLGALTRLPKALHVARQLRSPFPSKKKRTWL